ncbi:MAG: 4-phosphoerythronate dehydrogenase [Acidobacteria bacterium]|nr:4-phosphoerythronate dehydrogenase [Acidobacteriota bacterium]
MPMIIAVDEVLPFHHEAFSNLGELRPLPGRRIAAADLVDADALVVRTVTRVDKALLHGTSVRFVGGASAGKDHIDEGYLRQNNIHFCYAAGSNAESVSEYVFTALFETAVRKGLDLQNRSLAVIGVGNVGSRVAAKARALGMDVMLCDPPLRDATGDPRYRSFEEVLDADILSFHVPLTLDGPYPTYRMLNRDVLARLSTRQFIINSSRGPVVDGVELKKALQQGRIAGSILDVWEGEPDIDFSLLESVDIGTPHIAGTSLDGKIRATDMIREELSAFFGIESQSLQAAANIENRRLVPDPGSEGAAAVVSVIRKAFDVRSTDKALRDLRFLSRAEAAAGFDRLRNGFPLRPEFRHFTVELAEMHVDLAGVLEALGFQVVMEGK